MLRYGNYLNPGDRRHLYTLDDGKKRIIYARFTGIPDIRISLVFFPKDVVKIMDFIQSINEEKGTERTKYIFIWLKLI